VSFALAREMRPIDLRTFASRQTALAAETSSDFTLPLVCVRDLDAFVDRDELLRAAATVEPPYWALPWIGARAIASHLLALDTAQSLSDRSVLDLGCGLGLSGVAAGRRGARLTFADFVPEALDFARANAELHGLRDFETTTADFARDRLGRRFDWILAADVVYDPKHYSPLVEFLDAHLTESATLLLTESLRADARVVIEALAARGIRGGKQRLWLLEDGRPELTWLHRLART
jgi:predicted nicotinamide N-methyase